MIIGCRLAQDDPTTTPRRTLRHSGTYRMPLPSFTQWLEDRPEGFTDIGSLALVIARSGAGGISRQDLEKVVRLSHETMEDLLRAMVAAGQVVVLKVGGQIVYRATG